MAASPAAIAYLHPPCNNFIHRHSKFKPIITSRKSFIHKPGPGSITDAHRYSIFDIPAFTEATAGRRYSIFSLYVLTFPSTSPFHIIPVYTSRAFLPAAKASFINQAPEALPMPIDIRYSIFPPSQRLRRAGVIRYSLSTS